MISCYRMMAAIDVPLSTHSGNWCAAIEEGRMFQVDSGTSSDGIGTISKLSCRYQQNWRQLMLKKTTKKHGDQTTFHYLSFKPSLDPPTNSLDTGFKGTGAWDFLAWVFCTNQPLLVSSIKLKIKITFLLCFRKMQVFLPTPRIRQKREVCFFAS